MDDRPPPTSRFKLPALAASQEELGSSAHAANKRRPLRLGICAGSFLLVVALASMVAVVLGCSQPGPAASGSTPVNPASGRMGFLARLPAESDEPPVAVVPNPAPFIDAATLTAAKIEANALQTAARVVLAAHPSLRAITSDDLSGEYAGGPPKAKYYFAEATGRVTRVDAIPGGWRGIVFRLSTQSWLEGAADNDRTADQDIP